MKSVISDKIKKLTKKKKVEGIEGLVDIQYGREDHPAVSNQLYAFYAEGKNKEAMKAVIGEEAMSTQDKKYLDFLKQFEEEFVAQGQYSNRSIYDSLDKAWELLRKFKKVELDKFDKEHIRDYYYEPKMNVWSFQLLSYIFSVMRQNIKERKQNDRGKRHNEIIEWQNNSNREDKNKCNQDLIENIYWVDYFNVKYFLINNL